MRLKTSSLLSSTGSQITRLQTGITEDLQFKTLPYSTVSLKAKTLLLRLISYMTSCSEIKPKSFVSLRGLFSFSIFIFSQASRIFQLKQIILFGILQEMSSSCEVLKILSHLPPDKPRISFTIWMSTNLSQIYLFTLILESLHEERRKTDLWMKQNYIHTHIHIDTYM